MLPLPLWIFLWDSRLWVWMKFSSHRKCKDKRFCYKSTNSYLVWIFSWNRRENYKTFCLIKWSSFPKRRKSINSFKGSGRFFKVCRGMHAAKREMCEIWAFLNVPEYSGWGWFCEIFSWKAVFSKQCFHRIFSELCMCQSGYLPRMQVQSYIKQK